MSGVLFFFQEYVDETARKNDAHSVTGAQRRS